TVEVLAEVMAVLRPISERLFKQARRDGRREPNEAYLADALLDMARRAAGTGAADAPPIKATKVLVRIDWDALIRGFPIGDELSEIAGVGPVPVSVVQAMIDSGDAFLAAVVTKGKDVHTVAHLTRRPRAHQRSALQWLSPTCMVEGCNASLGLEIDHVEDWAKTRITLLSLLNPLCRPHHKMKTNEGWALVRGHGKRAFVGPKDPQHPKNANAPPVAAM
ncbi:MAG: HNH endonuclease, partial [Actinobacteria bacterium]|nr:HNH endonuclease [Actinomycetota bacterium]